MTSLRLALLFCCAVPALAAAQSADLDPLARPGGRFDSGPITFPSRGFSFQASPATFRADPIAARVPDAEEPLRFRVRADYLFEPGVDGLRPQADGVLKDVLRQSKALAPRFALLIESFVDATTTGPDSDRIAQARGDALRQWFIRDGGLAPQAVKVNAVGSRAPLRPEVKTDGSIDRIAVQRNRRIEIGVLPIR